MSRALSANVLAGIAGGSNPVYLLQVDSDTTTYYWATQPFTDTEPAPDQVYVSSRLLRNGLGKVKTKIDIRSGGNIAEVNQFEFSLVNGDLYSDTIAAQYFENRRVELRLIFADQDDPFWSNAAPLFNGFVQSVAWDTDRIVFKCEDGWKRWARDIPPLTLSLTDEPLLPQDNIGKPYPILIGDWSEGWISGGAQGGLNKTGIASNRASSSRTCHRDYFKAYLLKPFQRSGDQTTENPRAVTCCHETMVGPADDDKLRYWWNNNRKCWHRVNVRIDTLNGEAFGTTLAGAKTIEVFVYDQEASGDPLPFWNYIDFVPLRDTINEAGSPTSPENAIDNDDSTYATLVSNGDTVSYEISGESGSSDRAGKWADVYYWVDDVNGNYAAGDVKIKVEKDGETALGWSNIAAVGSLQSVEIGSDTSGFNISSGQYSGIRIKFLHDGSYNDEFRLRCVFLRVAEKGGDVPRSEIYETGMGLMYGSWIDDNHTPSPALAEGDLIKNPVYLVEALLLGWTEATISDIDTAAFDAVATHRSSWKIARDILEQKDVFDYIAEICREFCFGFFERADGLFTVRRIDLTAAAVTTYGTETFLKKGQDTSFKVGRLGVKEAYNDFILHYKVNVATGEPEKMLFVRHPDEASYDASYTNLSDERADFWDYCHDSYTNFQQVNLWEYTAEWIRDDATAELFLKWIIWRLTQRRHEVSFAAPLSVLALELCDEAKFTHPLMPAAMDSTTRFRLTEQTIDPSTDTIDCTFTEVA
ncbi:hypothetical protein M0R72_10890 [Candidatus Pacearchaeota archaeon]|jgi:hypothetical protein|nr:hypothetical protein [Candidatus Pacearchaeota archaeon]